MDIKSIYQSSEGRFNRARFWQYSILLGLVLGLIGGIIQAAAPGMIGIILSSAVSLAAFFYFIVNLYYKRAHDLGEDGHKRVKTIKVLYVLTIAISLVSNIIMMQSIGNPHDMQKNIAALQSQMETATTQEEKAAIGAEIQSAGMGAVKAATNPIVIGLSGLTIILAIRTLVLTRPLMFKKGTDGANAYGPDPLASK